MEMGCRDLQVKEWGTAGIHKDSQLSLYVGVACVWAGGANRGGVGQVY